MSQPDPHPVRRVVLPSGKTIEVVYFEEMADGTEPAGEAPAAPGPESLSTCRSCGSGLVYPLDWQEADRERWRMTLRCPECELIVGGTYGQAVVEAFEEDLDRGTAELVAGLRGLAQANMADDVARFTEALAADAIEPMDF